MSTDKLSTKKINIILRVMEVLEGEHSKLADIAKIIGYDNMVKLMKYFNGETVKFPTSEVAVDDCKYIECYVRSRILGEWWEPIIQEVYGELTPDRIKEVKGRVRTLNSKLKNYSSEFEHLALSDIEEFTKMIKEDMSDEIDS